MISIKVLDWYKASSRTFPWRKSSTDQQDPYQTWLSEIMLQQTTTTTVIPYFEDFTRKWPTVEDLARADLDDVLHAWQGLGYYARARNMHKCAQQVTDHYQGQFPSSVEDLRKLPGIGPYTSAAIASIAFDGACAPVDGNIARIFSRLYELKGTGSVLHKRVEPRLRDHVPTQHNGDFVQALMDIGAGICTPKNPKCQLCPLQGDCLAYKHQSQDQFPQKKAKLKRPTRYAVVFWAINEGQEILTQRRPEKGLLGGMIEFPSTEWGVDPIDKQVAFEQGPIEKGQFLPDPIKHTFSHFDLELTVLKGVVKSQSFGGTWVAEKDLTKLALPTVMKKVAKVALGRG